MPFAGASQTWPQSPQFLAFVAVSTQLAPHLSKPLAQLKSQVDAAHVALPCVGLGHAVSHAPQWLGDVAMSKQEPPQLLSAPSQAALHVPFEHTSPAPQVLPQPPQLAGSLAVSAH